MQNKLITVVIPIYNVEKYIEECLNSIINQTYKHLEILCIDDCGEDNSIKIVEEYSKKDNRIKIVYNKENAGQGYCRNIGIQEANGDYIYFIDSDDFIDLDYIEKMYNEMIKNDVDVVCQTKILKYYGENSIRNKYIKHAREFVLNKKLEWDETLLKNSPISPVCKLYKIDFFRKNNVYFAENRLKFEDFYFWYILRTRIKTIEFLHNSTYFYRQRNNSTMYENKYNKNDCYDAIYIIENIYNYYKKYNLLNKYPIPFKWLNKYFKKINDKDKFFNLIKEKFILMKNDIFNNKNIYQKNDINFFSCILNNKKYSLFRIMYFLLNLF